MDAYDIQEALLSAVTGEMDREWDHMPSSKAVARQQSKNKRDAALFRNRVIRFLGEMPEDWTIMELIDALEGDREGEVMEGDDD